MKKTGFKEHMSIGLTAILGIVKVKVFSKRFMFFCFVGLALILVCQLEVGTWPWS